MAKDYTSSLNLPQTAFSMRANLPQREPEMLEGWKKIDLYNLINQKNADKEAFVLHDGPPFSNGNIHMGTAMNKILKDIINKSKMMQGYRVPYTPGWDNHGMPIESAIIKQNKLDRNKMSIPEFRTACQKFAEKYVGIQMESFKRLGVLADWDAPYTTMNPAFEAREIKVFGEMFNKGYIYKGMKPVYWCPTCVTALAEAEIEYAEDPCTSIYVKFKVSDDKGKLSGICEPSNTYFIIWTTTTWTLPGNQAIALNPDEIYVVAAASNGENYIVAKALLEKTMQAGNIENYKIIAEMPGKELEYMSAQHPFLDRQSLVANADYVTMDSGTGCVHTAGGFGADDYITSRRYNIDVVVPVNDHGYQTEDAGKFAGLKYSASNEAILADLKESGALFASENIVHQYPHCWRCNNPIIFRATPQWFCSVEKFKDDAINACENVDWIPAWGGERMIQMVRDRADWCISRQRNWGLPITAFYCAECDEKKERALCTMDIIDNISDIFAKEGSNAWFIKDASELLPSGYTCPSCGGKSFVKDTNTLDGWFDSGSSHFAVLENKENMKWPADLYLEGADQYRGWFQSSLLCAVGSKNQGAPYKQILTHGWVVDGKGEAMHKSKGNSVYPEDVIKKYGADVVRLWVASADYHVDVRCSDVIFSQLSESYRKFRNTARVILGNLSDFNPDTDMLELSKLMDIDKWAISRVNAFTALARKAYDEYEFHDICQALNNFCTTDMSKLYIDIIKDRVYVEGKESYERRSAQTALYIVLSALTRIMAPVLSYTCDEIWLSSPHSANDDTRNVFLNTLPEYKEELSFPEIEVKYSSLFALRDDVMKALEIARSEKLIGKSLDAKITVYAPESTASMLSAHKDELTTLFIVSGVEVVSGTPDEKAYKGESLDIFVLVEGADGSKCSRCWAYSEKGISDGEGFVCERCRKILGI